MQLKLQVFGMHRVSSHHSTPNAHKTVIKSNRTVTKSNRGFNCNPEASEKENHKLNHDGPDCSQQ